MKPYAAWYGLTLGVIGLGLCDGLAWLWPGLPQVAFLTPALHVVTVVLLLIGAGVIAATVRSSPAAATAGFALALMFFLLLQLSSSSLAVSPSIGKQLAVEQPSTTTNSFPISGLEQIPFEVLNIVVIAPLVMVVSDAGFHLRSSMAKRRRRR